MQFWWVQWKKGGQGESGATPGVAGEAAGRSAAHKTLSRARAWRVAHKKVLRNRTRVGWVLAMVATLCIRQHLADEIHTELRDAARCAEIHSCAFIFYSFAVSPAIYAQQGATTSPPTHFAQPAMGQTEMACSWWFQFAVKSVVLTLNCESAIQGGPLECRCHLRLLANASANANACGWP